MKSLQTRKRERPWSDSHTVQLVKQRGMQGRATTTLMSRTPRSMVRWSSSLLLPRPLDPRHVREIFKIRERPWPKPCPNSRDKEVQLSVREGKFSPKERERLPWRSFFLSFAAHALESRPYDHKSFFLWKNRPWFCHFAQSDRPRARTYARVYGVRKSRQTLWRKEQRFVRTISILTAAYLFT